MLRVEFNQTHQEYYVGFDAIVLVGHSIHQLQNFIPLSISSSLQNAGLDTVKRLVFLDEYLLQELGFIISDYRSEHSVQNLIRTI